MSVFCKNCGNQLLDTAKFCNKCGTPNDYIKPTEEKNYCNSCGRELPVGESICAKCVSKTNMPNVTMDEINVNYGPGNAGTTAPAPAPLGMQSAQAVPVQPNLAQSAQAQSAPIQSKPMQFTPTPAQPVPMQPTTAPMRVDAMNANIPMPNNQAPSVPIQEAQGQSEPIQAVPAQAVPVDATPIQNMPIQGTPEQNTPIQGAPVQSATGNSSWSRPAQNNNQAISANTTATSGILPEQSIYNNTSPDYAFPADDNAVPGKNPSKLVPVILAIIIAAIIIFDCLILFTDVIFKREGTEKSAMRVISVEQLIDS